MKEKKIDIFNIIGQDINDLKKEEHISNDSIEGVYMFLSFDLVNSTAFKVIYKDDWYKMTQDFYNIIAKIYIQNENRRIKKVYIDNEENIEKQQFNIWKYVGDEVLLYKKIIEVNELYSNVASVYEHRRYIMKELKKQNPVIIESNLNIKITVWIADCGLVENKHIYHNMVYYNPYNQLEKNIDFLGPDIDEGFRIGKLAERDKVLVSAKLAYVLWRINRSNPHQQNIIESNFRIAYFTELKGIWQGKKYPVVVYSDNFNRFYDELEYDEFLESDIVKGLDKSKSYAIDLSKIQVLDRVFRNIHKEKEINDLIQLLKEQEKYYTELKTKSKIVRYQKMDQVEVEITAICYNSRNEIFAVKRSQIAEYSPNTWEFGCAKLNIGEDWESAIKREYKNKYGLNLKIDSQLLPLSVSTLYKGSRMIPGITVLVKLDEEKENLIDQKIKKSSKYTKYKWINSLTQIEQEPKIDKFEENFSKAIKLIEQQILAQEKGQYNQRFSN